MNITGVFHSVLGRVSFLLKRKLPSKTKPQSSIGVLRRRACGAGPAPARVRVLGLLPPAFRASSRCGSAAARSRAVWGLGLLASGFAFRVWGLAFRVFRLGVFGLRFGFLGFGFWGFGFRFWGLGFCVWALAFGVWVPPAVRVPRPLLLPWLLLVLWGCLGQRESEF